MAFSYIAWIDDVRFSHTPSHRSLHSSELSSGLGFSKHRKFIAPSSTSLTPTKFPPQDSKGMSLSFLLSRPYCPRLYWPLPLHLPCSPSVSCHPLFTASPPPLHPMACLFSSLLLSLVCYPVTLAISLPWPSLFLGRTRSWSDLGSQASPLQHARLTAGFSAHPASLPNGVNSFCLQSGWFHHCRSHFHWWFWSCCSWALQCSPAWLFFALYLLLALFPHLAFLLPPRAVSSDS